MQACKHEPATRNETENAENVIRSLIQIVSSIYLITKRTVASSESSDQLPLFYQSCIHKLPTKQHNLVMYKAKQAFIVAGTVAHSESRHIEW